MGAPTNDVLSAPALAWGLLARCVASPLPESALQRIAADEGHPSLAAALAAGPDGARLALHLAREHALLFRGLRAGLGPPPPFESLWREGVCMGQVTGRVIAAYIQAGFPLPADGQVPDALATELLFMASLADAEARASASADAAALGWRQAQARFLSGHLVRWVPAWAAAVSVAAGHPFYPALAAAITGLLAEESARLASLADAGGRL